MFEMYSKLMDTLLCRRISSRLVTLITRWSANVAITDLKSTKRFEIILDSNSKMITVTFLHTMGISTKPLDVVIYVAYIHKKIKLI